MGQQHLDASKKTKAESVNDGRYSATAAALVAVSLIPARTAHACSNAGKLAEPMRHAGQSALNGTTLDNDSAILARLKRLPESVRAHLHRNLGVQDYVDLVSCHPVLEGNAEIVRPGN